MNIFVGNLPYDVDVDELEQEFSAFGEVTSVSIPRDQYSGRPRGFGFVEMQTESEAKAAITGLNGKSLKGRAIVVNEARKRRQGDDRR
jgi:RNA recognition motif-containing protein